MVAKFTGMSGDLESTSLVQRIVLGCLADLEATGETPVNTAEIREIVSERLEDVDSETVGHVSETEVIRALNGLADTQLVGEQRPDDRSPVGKGRPVYDLDVDPETVRETLAEDDRVRSMLE